MSKEITQDELLSILQEWGNAVVNVGKVYTEKGDYEKAASQLVDSFYGYQEGSVLFKPTRAQHDQFRVSTAGAVSYFVGNNKDFAEDTGFALQPWTKVRFENAGFILKEAHAVAMGNYYFTDVDGQEKQVEYTFGVFKNQNDRLKITLHHSSLPHLHPKHPGK
jgi:hypothetical protein